MTSAATTSRSKVKIAHIADMQFGSGYSLGHEDQGGVNSRLKDADVCWQRAVGRMISEPVDLVVIAGDVFERPRPTPTEMDASGLRRLSAADIPVVGCVGNHDSNRMIGQKDALEIFQDHIGAEVTFASKPTLLTQAETGLPVTIALLPWVNPAHLAATDKEYSALDLDERNVYIADRMIEVARGLAFQAGQSNPPLGAILVAHAAIAGSQVGAEQATYFLREPMLPLSELLGMGFRYQAFGHLHRAQKLAPGIQYCGSLDRQNWGEAKEPKGWYLVTITEDAVTSEFVSSLPRPFFDIEWKDPAGWERELPGSEEEGATIKGSLVRIRYTTTPEIQKTLDLDAMRRAFYADGAEHVWGPIVTIVRDGTERAGNTLSEETGPLQAAEELWELNAIEPEQRRRLRALLTEALEAQA